MHRGRQKSSTDQTCYNRAQCDFHNLATLTDVLNNIYSDHEKSNNNLFQENISVEINLFDFAAKTILESSIPKY